jgi:hypothetical protein
VSEAAQRDGVASLVAVCTSEQRVQYKHRDDGASSDSSKQDGAARAVGNAKHLRTRGRVKLAVCYDHAQTLLPLLFRGHVVVGRRVR